MAVPKVLGADIELGNSLTGPYPASNLEAATRVLRASIRPPFLGVFQGGLYAPAAGEGGRHWLPNGGCLYIDMSHLEMCLPETASARNHAAALHAMLRIVRSCRRKALALLATGEDLFVNLHVSDGTAETSWGAHFNVLIERRLFDGLFDSRPHRLALLASFVAAAVPLFGQGLLLPEGGTCRYVTAARAHHLGELSGLATTIPFRRNLVNCRDEPHASGRLARLHLIAFDPNLQPIAIFLRAGLTQLVLAALEEGWFDDQLVLEDPVQAVRTWSESFAPTSGSFRPVRVPRPARDPITLLDWHRRLLEQLQALMDGGRIPPQVVPDGPEILDRFGRLLGYLADQDVESLAGSLDWALKWRILAEAAPQSGGDLASPSLRLLDQLYSHVDDQVGLFWVFWRNGLIDRCALDDAAIGRFVFAGDPETRSGLRGELVRRLRPWITSIDWDRIELARDYPVRWYDGARYVLELEDPAAASAPLVAALRQGFAQDDALLRWLTRHHAPARLSTADLAEALHSGVDSPPHPPLHIHTQ